MLLIVEDDWSCLLTYRNVLSTYRQVEGIDYIQARSYEEAKEAFSKYGRQIRAIILDHRLETEQTGRDIAWAVRRSHPRLLLVSCSTYFERNYPEGIRFFNKREELREAVRYVLELIQAP